MGNGPSRLQEQNKILEESKKRTIYIVKIQKDFKNLTKIKEERTSLTNHINVAVYIGKKKDILYQDFIDSLN